MNIPTGTLLELKCCECECYLSRIPIYVGENGTAICGRCPIPNQDDLTNSREQIPTYYRMIPYENLIKEISFPCMYQNNGCAIKMLSKYLQHHEENCNYRPFICPLMSLGKCDWIGRKEKLIEHCQTQHADRIFEHPCVCEHDYTINSSEPYITIIFNTLFLVDAKVCLTTNKIYYNVYCFGDVTNNFNTNFKLVIQRQNEKIIKNGQILQFAQKMTKKNVFVSCSIHSLIDILNGSDKTTFSIHIEPWRKDISPSSMVEPKNKNKCVYCNSFYDTENADKFCKICDSLRITCKECAFKDIEVKTVMHKTNFCKFTKWCWVCNTHLICLPNQNQHYDEEHLNVIHLEDIYWNISQDDFKTVNGYIIIDFIIDSKYDRFFCALVKLSNNYMLKICCTTIKSEEACKLACRISIQNNSDDNIKYLILNYDFQSEYDWHFNLPKDYLFFNNTLIKIDFLEKE